MKIEGEKIYLAPFEKLHLYSDDYFRWLNDFEVTQYLGREEYLKPIAFKEVEAYVKGLWGNKFCHFFAIYDKSNDKFIGTSKINYVDQARKDTDTADIGIMIGNKGYWGKGLATDVIHTASEYSFTTLKARKLTAGALSMNGGVIKAFKKNGYKQEASLRQQILVSGVYMDHVLLGCFPGELV